MSDDDVSRAEPPYGSPSTALSALIDSHDCSISPEEARARAAELAAIEQFSFNFKLALAIGKPAATELSEFGDKANQVCRSLARLLTLRAQKRSELQQLVEAFRSSPEQPDSAESEEAQMLRAVIETGRNDQRERIASVATLLMSLESEMIESLLDSPFLKRARKIAEAHEHDGLLANPPERATGYVLKRLIESVLYAVRAALPVIEVIYGDPTLKPMSDAGFKAMLIRRLENQSPGYGEHCLAACADSIELTRHRRNRGQHPLRTPAEAVDQLIKRLRHHSMAEWLSPRRDTRDGYGSGPKAACYQLLEQMTGVGHRSIIDYVGNKHASAEQRRRKRR